MKEIKEYFKNGDYECYLFITDKSVDIEIAGQKALTNELLLDYYSFDEPYELLDYLKKTTSSRLSIFTDELSRYFKRANCFNKIPKNNSTY